MIVANDPPATYIRKAGHLYTFLIHSLLLCRLVDLLEFPGSMQPFLVP